MAFYPETIAGKAIKEDADYQGVRIRFLGFLENARIHMQIDIGFGDVVVPEPLEICTDSYTAQFPDCHLVCPGEATRPRARALRLSAAARGYPGDRASSGLLAFLSRHYREAWLFPLNDPLCQ
jgi:hypothetical protein